MLHHEAFALGAYLYSVLGGTVAFLGVLLTGSRVRPGAHPRWRVWLARQLGSLAWWLLGHHAPGLGWWVYGLRARCIRGVVCTLAWRRRVYVGTLTQLYAQLEAEEPGGDWIWELPKLVK